MRADRATYLLGEWLSRGVRTLFRGMVSIEPPERGPDPNAAIERTECYRVEGHPDRVALQDAERPLAWIESDVSIPLAALEGEAEWSAPDAPARAPRPPYNHTDK